MRKMENRPLHIIRYFKDSNKKICFRGITKEVVDILQENYPGKFEYIEERDLFDYVYDGESLRVLGGRKNQKKRNHINAFLKDYEGRYEYRILDEEDFEDCLNLLKEWTVNKEENNEEVTLVDKFFKYNNDELFNVLVNDKDFKFVENIGLVR